MKLTLPALATTLALATQAAYGQCVITPTGTLDPNPPGDGWSAIAPIGFAFPFNGTTYTDLYYSDHCVVSLSNGGTPPAPPGGAQLWAPSTGGLATFLADVICPYWGDNVIGGTPGAGIYVDNTSGSHCTITWVDNVPFGSSGGDEFTAQVTLYPSGEILINLDSRCDNTSSTYGALETVIGVAQDGFAVPASSDLSTNTVVTSDPTVFEIFVGPGPGTTNTPDPNFDLDDTSIRFLPATPGWVVLTSPLVCASTASVGTGCSGLSLATTNPPVLGGTWTLELSGINSQAPLPNFLAIGASSAPVPVGTLLPTLFAPGCEAYVSSFTLLDIGPAVGGVASGSLPIPAFPPALKGQTFSAQGIAIDTLLGLFATSNGQDATLGH